MAELKKQLDQLVNEVTELKEQHNDSVNEVTVLKEQQIIDGDLIKKQGNAIAELEQQLQEHIRSRMYMYVKGGLVLSLELFI